MKVSLFHKPRPEGHAQRIAAVSHAKRRLDVLLFNDGSYVVRELVSPDSARLIALVGTYAAALRAATRDLTGGAK
jgi:hypothetical protein